MGAAAYRRGTRCIIEQHRPAPAVLARADRDAERDEAAGLRRRVAELERDLARARRCLAATRYSHDQRMAEARADRSSSAASIAILCRLAFGADRDVERRAGLASLSEGEPATGELPGGES